MSSATVPSTTDKAMDLAIGATIISAEILENGEQYVYLSDGSFLFAHNGKVAHGGFE